MTKPGFWEIQFAGYLWFALDAGLAWLLNLVPFWTLGFWDTVFLLCAFTAGRTAYRVHRMETAL